MAHGIAVDLSVIGIVFAFAGTALAQQPWARASLEEVVWRAQQGAKEISTLGERITADLCAVGQGLYGGWVGYNFPKARFGAPPKRKMCYLLAANGTPYVVATGIYDVKTSIGHLAMLSGG